jgi:hypothetical protein
MQLEFNLGLIYRTSGGRRCLTAVPYIDWLEGGGGTPVKPILSMLQSA